MTIQFLKEPKLHRPDIIAAWPGIGNIGLIAVNHLREVVESELFARIDPWDFFYPRALTIEGGVLTNMDFPSSNFYYKRLEKKDVIFFICEEQPAGSRRAYEMSSAVLDMADHFEARRIYTAAAAVAPIHHSMNPRIWGVPNTPGLIAEVRKYPSTILMSDITGRHGGGKITGLNGLLLGLARRRGLEGVCLLGEVPAYISQFPTIYPKSSKSIAQVLAYYLGIEPDMSKLNTMIDEVEQNIDRLYQMIPVEMRQRIEQLKHTSYIKESPSEQITEQDKKRIMQEIEQFFNKGSRED